MISLTGSLVGNTLVGLVVVLSALAAGCLLWASLRSGWLRRRRQRQRERTRREFWGYE